MDLIDKILEKADHLVDFIGYRLDIIADKPAWWLAVAHSELPEFDYYLKNCVLDKNGPYDFTKRDCSTHAVILDTIDSVNYKNIKINQKTIYKKIKYSYWMSSPFNFKEEIITI